MNLLIKVDGRQIFTTETAPVFYILILKRDILFRFQMLCSTIYSESKTNLNLKFIQIILILLYMKRNYHPYKDQTL
jgi:hypothetical protein